MLLLRPPGVYRPQGDTLLLVDALRRFAGTGGARVLELGAGTGAVAMAAARAGAAEVVAVDVSARAVLTTRINARLRGLPVRAVRGDLFGPVADERFDVVIANPPYVCGTADPASVRGAARAWEAGGDGRALLDRICTEAPDHLAPGGRLLVLHSALNGVGTTLDLLRCAGMRASVVARRAEPFGPVMLGRAAELESRGLVGAGQRHEDLVVIRADLAGAAERPGPVSEVA